MYYQLDYQPNSAELFESLQQLDYAIFLDSCHPNNTSSRFDIISALPNQCIIIENQQTTLVNQQGDIQSIHTTDIFSLLPKLLKNYKPTTQLPVELPFTGGALGYIGYDLIYLLEKKLKSSKPNDVAIPTAVIGLYNWGLVIDHHKKQMHYIDHFTDNRHYLKIMDLLNRRNNLQSVFNITEPFKSNFTQASYNAAFTRIQQHLKEGDCYQINLCQRFSSTYQGNPWTIYKKLRLTNPAPFSGFMRLKKGAILSLSPERFIQVKNDIAFTQPIKGTRPRGKTTKQDQHYAKVLQQSDKDRAENTMIVDLLRNDFNHCCTVGSVQVDKLCQLHSFSNVFHLLSDIRGKLRFNQHSADLFRACFPGGSITGAPKFRAIQLINSLEPQQRSAFCGHFFYMNSNGNMDSNILIRSIICDDTHIYCYAGGGIVTDSVANDEYQETLIKINHLLQVLSFTFSSNTIQDNN